MIGHISCSKNLKALQYARSIRDVEKVINSIASGISEMKEQPFQISISASKDSVVTEIGDVQTGGAKTGSGIKGFDTEFKDGIKVPKSILVDAGRVDRIRNFIAELESAKVVALSGEFKKLSSTKALIASINTSIREANLLRKAQIGQMFETGKDLVPEAHIRIARGAVQHLTKVLDKSRYSSIARTSYVIPDKALVERRLLKASPTSNNVLFQTFIKVKDLVDDEDYAYEFYLVLTSRLEGSRLAYSLTSLKSFRVPGTFPIGESILGAAALKKHINAFLSVDAFVGKLDQKPITKTSTDLRKSGIHDIKGVSGVRVANDKIMVRVSGLSKTELKNTTQEVLAALRSLLKVTGKATLHHKVVSGNRAGSQILQITLGPSEKPSKLEMTKKKASVIGNALGLDRAQMNDMLRAL